MAYLLNLAYLFVLIAASPWLIWSGLRKGKYREGFSAKLFGAVRLLQSPTRPRLWLHAVSVGEVNLLAPLFREIAVKHPEWECVVSTTTATGYALATKKYPHLIVFYAPLDLSWAVRRAMRRVRPTALVLIELELWPNLIRAAKENGAKVAVVNGRLSARSFRGYGRIGWLVRRVMRQIDLIAAQSEEYADRFRALGARPEVVHVTGSLKFDGAQTNPHNDQTIHFCKLARFTDDDIVFVAGSTQAPEERFALNTFLTLKDEHRCLKLVLVPRHPHRFDEVAALLERSGVSWQRRSEIQGSGFNVQGSRFKVQGSNAGNVEPETWNLEPVAPFRILLVDTIGELSAWWGAAAIGFVGGSLGSRGGQNMIEPAAYGVATCFGPNTHNFRDVVQMLLANEAAVVVRSGEDLTSFVRRCIEDRRFAERLGEQAQTLIRNHRGATMQTLGLITRLIASPVTRRQEAA